jgi:hypothetical protein
MAKVLQIENYAASTIINLADDASLCAYFGEAGNRPLTVGGNVTRVFRFRATSTTKALARANVNAFILALREAIKWNEDNLVPYSWFLREAADGETPVRSLILGFEASAVSEGSAIDAYQTMNTALYVDVALTLQNHREEPTETTLTVSSASADSAIGKKLQLSGAASTDLSRLSFGLTSTLTGTGVYLYRVWAGMFPAPEKTGILPNENFQHIWAFDFWDTSIAGTDSTETTSTGSYGTNIVKVSFATAATMRRRALLNVLSIYTAASAAVYSFQARGEFLVLLRYKIDSGSGTVLARIGVSGSIVDTVAYNEAVLLDDSGNYRFAEMGVVKIPPRGLRQEMTVQNIIENVCLTIDAQRLSGNATLVLDTLTLIPYKHFMSVENTDIRSTRSFNAVTNEGLDVYQFTSDASTDEFISNVTVKELKNFLYPVGTLYSSARTVQVVLAAERQASQIHGDNLDHTTFTIYEAFEGYNG